MTIAILLPVGAPGSGDVSYILITSTSRVAVVTLFEPMHQAEREIFLRQIIQWLKIA